MDLKTNSLHCILSVTLDFYFVKVVLNHETYILDLDEANKGNLQWKLEYSAKVIYINNLHLDIYIWLYMYIFVYGC